MIKFYLGKRIQTTDRETVEEIEVPKVVFCTQHSVKTDVLLNMGYEENFLRTQFHTYMEDFTIPDINEVWENATYSMEELSINWSLMDRKRTLIM